MGLSETIIAAMIGAGATMMTALFQLTLAFRARNKPESRPKRNALRSLMWVLALMLASGVSGFGFSQLRIEQQRQDLRNLKDELTAQMQALASSTARLVQMEGDHGAQPVLDHFGAPVATAESVEAVVRLQRCHADAGAAAGATTTCQPERTALCAAIPAQANVSGVEMFVKADDAERAWPESRVELDQDSGGVTFANSSLDYAPGPDLRAVCVDVLNASSTQSHLARLKVNYLLAPHLNTAQATIAARP